MGLRFEERLFRDEWTAIKYVIPMSGEPVVARGSDVPDVHGPMHAVSLPPVRPWVPEGGDERPMHVEPVVGH